MNEENEEISSIDNNSKDIIEKIFLTDFSTIQTEIGRYDSHSLIIKGWAITLWSGLMYFIIKESTYELFLIQIIMLLVFWSFDALYKFFQRKLALRYSELQYYFKGYSLRIKNGVLDIISDKSSKEGLKIINPRENFQWDKADERKPLCRCILLRAVSVVYLYLISFSFLTSLVIINFCIPILISSLIILSFGIFNYITGIDDFIEEHKKIYLLFFYSSLTLIAANSILMFFIV